MEYTLQYPKPFPEGDSAWDLPGSSENRSTPMKTSREQLKENKMRLPRLLTLAGLAISFALPSLAQEQNAISPKVRQQIESVSQKFQDAYNARDIDTIAALRTQDAIEVRSWQGLASGVDEITKRFESDWKGNPGKMVNKIVALYPIGNAICEIANSDVGGWMAQTTTIYVRQGADWKAKITYVNNTLPTEPVTPQEKQ